MFIDDEKKIKLCIFYKKLGRYYSCFTEKDFRDLDVKEEEKDSFKKVNIVMKDLTWGLYNEIQENSFSINKSGDRQFNYRLYKENRLTMLIESWDAVSLGPDGEAIPIPANEKNIKSLSPEIAELIIAAYDDESYFTDAEEKK